MIVYLTNSICTIGDARTNISGEDAATVLVRRGAAADISATTTTGSDATEKRMLMVHTTRGALSITWLEGDATVGDVWKHVADNIPC